MEKELKKVKYIIRNQIIKNKYIKNNKTEILNNELFKENNKKKYNKISFNKSKNYLNKKLYINNILLIIFFLIIFFPICLSDRLKLNKIIEIEITIKGNGNQNILSNDYNYELPNEVLVNGNVYNNYKNKTIYNLTSRESNITMRWNTSITNFSHLFESLPNITNIKFLKFNNSIINNMSCIFYDCNSLKSIDFINFDTSLVNDMRFMFYGCSSLTSLNLKNFNTSLVTNMRAMFYKCKNLYFLNFDNFNTSLVNDMSFMFYGCSSLTSLNLNKFNTSLVVDMSAMFYNCISLISINLKNFNTSHVHNMFAMFKDCNSLISLNLNKFDTSLVSDMYAMFYNCKSLKCLNIDNFDTSLVNNMSFMFYNCSSLISINLNNFNTSLVNNMRAMFKGSYNLITLNLNNFNTSLVTDMTSMFQNCTNLQCLNFNNFNTSRVTLMNSMFYNCSSLTYLNLDNFDTSLVTDMSYMFYGCLNLIYFNLNSFNTSLYAERTKMFNLINNKLIYCINETKAYRITSLLSNYIKNCSYIYNNGLGIICNDSSLNNKNISNYCYFDDDNENKNNISYINNNTYLYNISNINFGIDELKINCNSNEFYNVECKINNNISNKDDLINNIKNKLTNGSIDSLISNIIENEKKDIILKDNNTLYQITSSYNQNNNNYNDISSITLGECEDILKKEYKIDNNLSLLILKIDYFLPDSLIPIIGYEIFHPITKKKLDLTFCKDVFINLNIPVFIEENDLFKYDPENQYYQDECYPSTTDNGTDIIIKDRQNEYNDNNMSICENNCTFKEYDNETKKSNCECKIKSKQLVISELIDQADILSYNFTSKSESFNMVTMKCYYTLFTKEGLSKNMGSYIMIFTIILILISSILFYKCGYNLLVNDIKEIIELKEVNMKENNINEINIKETNIINCQRTNITKKKRKNIDNFNDHNILNNVNSNNNSKSSLNLNINNGNINTVNIIDKNIDLKNNENSNNSIIYTDYEMNSFSYYDALKYDKRNYYKYYFSLIKVKHPLIFSFCPKKDYNSLIIKLDLFFLSFSIYYFINALFFDETTIHKIYEDEGTYNFIYLLPHIIYSFIISHILVIIIKYFSLSEKNIYQIKMETSFEKAKDKNLSVKRGIKIKYICFFCLSILFLLFFWYYLSSFSAVYANTQIYLVKNILISFGLSLIYPFIINLLPSFLRIYALKENNRKCIFNCSKIIQLI